MLISLPTWKAYLYSLKQRLLMVRQINTQKYSRKEGGVNCLYFKKQKIFHKGDIIIINRVIDTFGEGRSTQTNIKKYLSYVDLVEKNQERFPEREVNIAYKLSQFRLINEGDIEMEIKELKKFAKEVGISFGEMKHMDEDQLITEIISRVDSDKFYSEEFREWYDELYESEPERFEEETKEDNKVSNEENVDWDEIIDEVENAENIKELRNIIKNYGEEVFPKDLGLIKIIDEEELQDAMIEAIEAASTKPKEKKKGIIKDKKKEDDEDHSFLVSQINKAETVEDLKEIINDEYDVNPFKNVSTRGRQLFENLKVKMLMALGVEIEDENEDEDEEEPVEEVIIEKPKRGRGRPPKQSSKEKEAVEEKEIELTPTLVKWMVKAKDIEGLTKAADGMGIKLSSIDKRSIVRISEKLIHALTGETPKKYPELEPENKNAPNVERKTLYQLITEMVNAGKDEQEIFTKAWPYFEERDKTKIYAKEKIKQYVGIVKFENNIK